MKCILYSSWDVLKDSSSLLPPSYIDLAIAILLLLQDPPPESVTKIQQIMYSKGVCKKYA